MEKQSSRDHIHRIVYTHMRKDDAAMVVRNGQWAIWDRGMHFGPASFICSIVSGSLCEK